MPNPIPSGLIFATDDFSSFLKAGGGACADGDVCANWLDQISALPSSIPAALTGPVYHSSTLGHPGLTFGGVNSCLSYGNALVGADAVDFTVITCGVYEGGSQDAGKSGFIFTKGLVSDTPWGFGAVDAGYGFDFRNWNTYSMSRPPTIGDFFTFGSTFSSTTGLRFCVNGVPRKCIGPIAYTSQTAAMAVGAVAFGGSFDYFWKGPIVAIYVYNRKLSAAEYLQVDQYLHTHFGQTHPLTLGSTNATWNGDSISTFPLLMAPGITETCALVDQYAALLGISVDCIANFSEPGKKFLGATNTVSSDAAEVTALTALFPATKKVNVIYAGTNDLGSTDPTTLALAEEAYGAARIAEGDFVVFATCLSRGDFPQPAFDTNRAIFNAHLLSHVAGNFNGIADIASDPTMGPNGAWSNLTYWNGDTIHPIHPGGGIMAPYFVNAVTIPTTAALTGPTTGPVLAQSTAFMVILDNPANALVTISMFSDIGGDTFQRAPLGGNFTTATIPIGQTTGTFYLTLSATLGNRHISITTSPALVILGSPIAYNGTAAPSFAKALYHFRRRRAR
jgi:hypothetical protein